MKTKLIALMLATSLTASATEVAVNTRDAKHKLVTQKLQIPTLNEGLAETQNFKVLKGHTDEVIDLDRDSSKAGTVLHHMNIAREYFINELGADFVKTLPQINVRIEMSKPFNENLHFIADSHNEEFNNALTIPASSKKALDSVTPWGVEIWFRPMKEIDIDNVVYQAADEMDRIDTMALLGPLMEKSASDAMIQATLAESVNGLDYMGYLAPVLYTVGVLEIFPKVMKLATKSLKSKAYLDTALIPEVIYHEFAHVALSDHVSVRKSTPLNEGMANYFAAVINQSSKIAANNGAASKNVNAYNGNSKEMYNSRLETKASGQTNFVFSYLWRIRDRFNTEFTNGNKLADKMIYHSRKHIIYSDKPIKDDLVQSLRKAIDETFSASEQRKARMILNDVTLKAGI